MRSDIAGSYNAGNLAQKRSSQAATYGFVVLTVLAVVLLMWGMAFNESSITYLSVATVSFLLPLGVGLFRSTRFDPFEPINLVALAIFFGTTLRAFWLYWSESDRVEFIMMETTFDDVLTNAPWILTSIAALCVGYATATMRIHLEKFSFIRDYSLSLRRTWLSVIIGCGMALVGTLMLVNSFGIGFDSGFASESYKRVHEYVDDSGQVIYGTGTERFIAGFGAYTFLFMGALMLLRMLRLTRFNLAVLAGVALLAIVGPFLTSSRSSLILLMLNLMIFLFYYGKLRSRTIVIAVLSGVFIVATLGVLREENQTDMTRDLTAIDRVVGSGNSLDFVRTSAIIDRVPEIRPYLNGQSYAALLSAPIPRSMWLDKPQVGLGSYVKGEIFGEDVRLSGWPSGMIAEGWMNFGFIGLILPMLLFGAMLRVFYESCRPLLGISFPVTLIYAVSIWRLGFGTIGMNFAHGITQTLVYFVPVLILLVIARAPNRATVARPAMG